MTETVVVYTSVTNSGEAGEALGEQVLHALKGGRPDAVILFISPRYNSEEFLKGMNLRCQPKVLVGCSSAGEFTSETQGDGLACAIAVRSSELKFAAGIGRGIREDRKAAVGKLVSAFEGVDNVTHRYSSALILTDALAGHADDLIEQLTIATGGNYQFFGGGAGDDANFRRTSVICGTEISSDAVVGLEILSNKPVGVGVRHGWLPSSDAMRVTEAQGTLLVSVNATRAMDVFKSHAAATGQAFDESDPMPFFLHNIIGIDSGNGFKLRVPLATKADGSIVCAAEIPTGATIRIMSTDHDRTRDAAAEATRDALKQLNGHAPKVAIFFDCVATRLRMGKEFGYELDALREALGPTQFAGCNTYGQVARSDGQFSGFHNCTAVVCILPA